MGGSNFSRWGELPLLFQMGGGDARYLAFPPISPHQGNICLKIYFFCSLEK